MKKAELIKDPSFGSSVMLKFVQHPALSAAFSRRVRSFWVNKNQLIGHSFSINKSPNIFYIIITIISKKYAETGLKGFPFNVQWVEVCKII
jgi:hypothetical protein